MACMGPSLARELARLLVSGPPPLHLPCAELTANLLVTDYGCGWVEPHLPEILLALQSRSSEVCQEESCQVLCVRQLLSSQQCQLKLLLALSAIDGQQSSSFLRPHTAMLSALLHKFSSPLCAGLVQLLALQGVFGPKFLQNPANGMLGKAPSVNVATPGAAASSASSTTPIVRWSQSRSYLQLSVLIRGCLPPSVFCDKSSIQFRSGITY